MSDSFMPIDLRQIATGQAGTETKKAAHSDDSNVSKEASNNAASATQQDSLELSDQSQLVQALISDLSNRPIVNESKVETLRNSIASGEFSVSADKIASSMLALEAGLRKLN